MTGGPVTEKKVDKMITDSRNTQIKQDIMDSEANLKKFIKNGVSTDLEGHQALFFHHKKSFNDLKSIVERH